MRYLKTAAQVVVAFALACSPAFAQRPLDITWVNAGLTVHVSDAPLADVMQQVVQLTGMEMVGQEKLNGTLSVDFANLPLEAALVKMLADVNYVVQEVAGADRGAPSHLLVRVHSMADGRRASLPVDGPIQVPALENLMTEEMHDAADEKEVEAEDDDPDAFEDARRQKLEAAKLGSEGAFGPDADVKQLLKLVENYYNDEVRLEALKALGTRPLEVSRRPAIKALGDDVWEIRLAAVEILGRDKDKDTLVTLGRLLAKNDDEDVRIGALRVLALRAEPESAVHLRAVLKDQNAVIRAAAEQILAELDRRAQAKRQNTR